MEATALPDMILWCKDPFITFEVLVCICIEIKNRVMKCACIAEWENNSLVETVSVERAFVRMTHAFEALWCKGSAIQNKERTEKILVPKRRI